MSRLILLPLVLVGTHALADLAGDVRCREIGFSVAAENRDAAAFKAFIDDDARFVGGSVARGPEAIAEAWTPFLTEGGPEIKWRPEFIEVLENGKLALTRGPYRLITADDNGESVERWGTFNSVWRLHDDGSWKVVFDAGSASDETPADEIKAILDQEDSCDDDK